MASSLELQVVLNNTLLVPVFELFCTRVGVVSVPSMKITYGFCSKREEGEGEECRQWPLTSCLVQQADYLRFYLEAREFRNVYTVGSRSRYA